MREIWLRFCRARYKMTLIFLICTLWINTSSAEPIPSDGVQDIIDNSTITRIQKPLAVRADRETLEYFTEHVEELTRHGKDFSRKELILEVKGNGQYGIQMPSKHITGEFKLVDRQPHKVIYIGHGNAAVFFNFSGAIVLEINYSTQKDEVGPYEDVRTSVHLKFDNAFFAFLARAAGPMLNPKLDKLIAKFSTKTKNVIEDTYKNTCKIKRVN
ncbi:MAG: hypothetical protein HUU08_09090 [Candidatus Brocadia sp.]|nr:hypothetical protein [Candidatus Brocadia sp.]